MVLPCTHALMQIMADIMTIEEHFGRYEGLKVGGRWASRPRMLHCAALWCCFSLAQASGDLFV